MARRKRGLIWIRAPRYEPQEVQIICDYCNHEAEGTKEDYKKIQSLLRKAGFERSRKQIHGKVKELYDQGEIRELPGRTITPYSEPEDQFIIKFVKKGWSAYAISKQIQKQFGIGREHTSVKKRIAILRERLGLSHNK